MKEIDAVKNVGHYMTLPYTIILRSDEEGDMVAQIKELPGCLAHGQDANEALEILKEFQQAWIERCIESGQPVPEPEEDECLPSGKWVQRVPRSLHHKLSLMAKQENVSLNQLVTSMLSQSMSVRKVEGTIEALMANCFASAFNHQDHGQWDSAVVFGNEFDWSMIRNRANVGILHNVERLMPKNLKVENAEATKEGPIKR